jgi:hypothetical protein
MKLEHVMVNLSTKPIAGIKPNVSYIQLKQILLIVFNTLLGCSGVSEEIKAQRIRETIQDSYLHYVEEQDMCQKMSYEDYRGLLDEQFSAWDEYFILILRHLSTPHLRTCQFIVIHNTIISIKV